MFGLKKIIYDRYKIILENQTYFMGIAILMVVLYHSGSRFFYLLFMGVDIFLLLSGYRIANSYNKRMSTLAFYKKRFSRIYPLFFVLTTLVTFVYIYRERGEINLTDYLCNISSLSYYNLGGFLIEWYLCTLFIFYLLTPILINICNRIGIYTLYISLLSVLLIFSVFDLHWSYECAIGRLPIYVLGILLYVEPDKQRQKSILSYVFFTYCIALCFTICLYINHQVNTYVLVYMSFPMLLWLVSWVIIRGKAYNTITTLGKYTLELYVANVIAMNLMPQSSMFSKYIIYVVLNIVCFLFIILINKVINRFFN